MKKNKKIEHNIRIWLCNMIFVIAGIILFWIVSVIQNDPMKNILSNIASVLLVSGVYNVISEYILRKSLIEYIVDRVHLKDSINNVGIDDIYLNLSDVQYRELIDNVNEEIDIVHAYGDTWTRNNIEFIKAIFLQKKIKVRVFMLSPDSVFCESIDNHYGQKKGHMKVAIERVEKYWEGFGKISNSQSNIEIYYYDGNPVHSLYRFDERIVIVLNKITNDISLNMPVILANRSDVQERNLYSMCIQEIETLKRKSKLIYKNESGGE